jgi:hypothetical protein
LDQVALRLNERLDGQEERLDRHARGLETLRKAVLAISREHAPAAVASRESVAPAPAPARGAPLIGYLLRGATEGSAWITPASASLDATPTEIHVHDRIKGLGRVTAVRRAREGWVVETDRGHLRMPDLPV